MFVVTCLPGHGVDLSRSIRDMILCLAECWADELRRSPLPALYSSGVFYRAEDKRNQAEEWVDPYTVLKRGFGDCDDLVIWRLAEILNAANYDGNRENLPAWPAVARKGTEYHVMIRHKADNSLEDPSLKLLRKGDKLQ